MCINMKKHNPFDWVHSEFGFLASLIVFFVAFIFTTYKPGAPLVTFLEGLLALNALFFLKQYGKNGQEIEKLKVDNANPAGGKGAPLT